MIIDQTDDTGQSSVEAMVSAAVWMVKIDGCLVDK